MEEKSIKVLDVVKENPSVSSKEVHEKLEGTIGYTTVKRVLSQLVKDGFVMPQGERRGRKYVISPAYELLYPIDLEKYYEQEIDERRIQDSFNLALIKDLLSQVDLFSNERS